MYSTNKAVEIKYPGRLEGLFKGAQPSEATNCLLEETQLAYHPNTLELESPIYDLSHCDYASGICIVRNMTLIWHVECPSGKCIRCQYSKQGTWEGTYTARSFWSHDHQVALTFNPNPPTILSCEGVALRVSHQEWGVSLDDFNRMKKSKDERVKRETATTEELALELTAAEMRLAKLVEKLFDIQCQSSVREPNPTRMARKLWKREDVMGKWRTHTLLETYQCSPLSSDSIRFRSTGNVCYKFCPVWVFINTMGWIESFIDPELSIISDSSPLSYCEISRYHYLELNSTLFMFDSVTNRTVKVPPASILFLPPRMGIIRDALEIESFHDLFRRMTLKSFSSCTTVNTPTS